MKIIKPSFSIIEQEAGLNGLYKHIELAGRTCYKSEDKIAQNSAKGFVDRMIKSGHGAMLEHGNVYLFAATDKQTNPLLHYENNPYSIVSDAYIENKKGVAVSTNYRVIIENNWQQDLQYICTPSVYHEKRISVLFHTQIAISREYNRHRVDSVAESSTRYCNYSKNKFGNEITINLPSWLDYDSISPTCIEKANIQAKLLELANMWGNTQVRFPKSFTTLDYWLLGNVVAEYCYMGLIENGWTAQQARVILPLDTSTDLVHTAFVRDWKHF